jgi:hypothetical protein
MTKVAITAMLDYNLPMAADVLLAVIERGRGQG